MIDDTEQGVRGSGRDADGAPRPLAHEAKEPLTPLAGPYGHPFHPILVTLPLGTWTASFVFDVCSLASSEPRVYAKASRDLIGLGVLGAAAAAMAGFLDYLRIPARTAAERTATLHMLLNLSATAAYATQWSLRGTRLKAESTRAAPVAGIHVAANAALLGLLGMSGWLGGKLSYHYGVRVADEATQREGFRQEPARR